MLKIPGQEIDWPEDVKRLKIALNALGYDATDDAIQWAYSQESEVMCASWLTLECWTSDEWAAKSLLKWLVEEKRP